MPFIMPSVFVSHGAPTIVVEDIPARRFLAGFGAAFARPRAIVVASAHWETRDPQVTAAAAPPTIHDFFGFPAPLYELRYPAPGLPALAASVVAALEAAGIRAAADPARGFDHGAWMPLSLMYPQADVPVVQLSVCPARDGAFHWRMGRALAGLRDEGVLVVGSGALTHNLAEFRAHRHDLASTPTPGYAAAFCDWVAARVANGDDDALIGWRDGAPEAVRAHPTPEHFLPLLVALGAAGVSWQGVRVHRGFQYGALGMDCYRFDSIAPPRAQHH